MLLALPLVATLHLIDPDGRRRRRRTVAIDKKKQRTGTAGRGAMARNSKTRDRRQERDRGNRKGFLIWAGKKRTSWKKSGETRSRESILAAVTASVISYVFRSANLEFSFLSPLFTTIRPYLEPTSTHKPPKHFFDSELGNACSSIVLPWNGHTSVKQLVVTSH